MVISPRATWNPRTGPSAAASLRDGKAFEVIIEPDQNDFCVARDHVDQYAWVAPDKKRTM
jgi:hypothetical protein